MIKFNNLMPDSQPLQYTPGFVARMDGMVAVILESAKLPPIDTAPASGIAAGPSFIWSVQTDNGEEELLLYPLFLYNIDLEQTDENGNQIPDSFVTVVPIGFIIGDDLPPEQLEGIKLIVESVRTIVGDAQESTGTDE